MQLQADPSMASGGARRPVRRVSNKLMALIMSGLVFVVGAVGLARWNDQVVIAPPPTGALVAARSIVFVDDHDGGVTVRDAETASTLGHYAAGEGSFVRGVLRSLVRERRARAIALKAPFSLSLYEDGRLILVDPLTDKAIDLIAFGPTNSGEFAGFLRPAGSGAVALQG